MRSELVAAADDGIPELLQKNVDWDKLLAMVDLHGTVISLASALDEHPEVVPQDFRDKLHKRIDENTGLNRALAKTLIDLLPLFEEIDVPVISFKGPEMMAVVYKSLDKRPYNDIDVVIDPRDTRAVIDHLMGHGYELKHGGAWNEGIFRWHNGETFKSPDNGHEVDLHWEIMSYRTFGCRFPFEELWRRRTTVMIMDKEIQAPSLEDLFLILCVHGCKHRWILLKWLRDIAVMSRLDPGLDWNVLERRASRAGARRMVALSLHLVNELLGVSAPEAALRKFPANRKVRALASEIRHYIFAEMDYGPDGRKRHEFYLRMRERLRDKIRLSIYLAKRSTDSTRWLVPLPALFSLLFSIAWPFWLLAKRTTRLLAQVRSNSTGS